MLSYAVYIILAIACIEVGANFNSNALFILCTASGVALGGMLIAVRYNLITKHAAFLVALSLILVIRSSYAAAPGLFNPQVYTGERLSFKALVSEEPRRNQNSSQVVLNNIELDNPSADGWYGKIILSLPNYSNLDYGDWVRVVGKFKDYTQIEDEGYRNYLYHHQIYGQIEWPSISVLSKGGGNALIAGGLYIQHQANNRINHILPQDEAAFLSGVVLGSRQMTSEQFSDGLKKTGTNHLIVASGYNISVLVLLVIRTKRFIGNKPALLLVLIMIICYTLISGLDPSIIRASIMASLALLAASFGRQKEALYLMILTGYTMLLLRPSWLYDVGFQLSFAATFGIVTLQSSIYDRLSRLPDGIKEIISTTVSAQIFVYPILITSFGEVSLISLVTNLLVIWVVPIIMFGGALVILLSFTSSLLAKLGATLIYPFLWYIKNSILLTANIPFASVAFQNFSWLTASIYYALVYYVYKLRSAYEKSISA